MISNLINRVASITDENKALLEEVEEFRALKTEINKARSVIEFDAKGTITAINENALKSLQYSDKELIGKHHREMLSRAESSSVEYIDFWENLAKGITQTGIFKLQNKSGNIIYMQGYYAPVVAKTGKLRKVVCYLTDITATKNNTIILESEEEALHASFGVVECTTDGKILECNELFLTPLGYNKEELVGQSIKKILTAEDASSTGYSNIWADLANGERHIRQIKRITKTGEELWYQATYSPVKDESGKPVKVIIFSVDITEDKKRNTNYEGQIKAIRNAQSVIEMDIQGIISNVNAIFCKKTGYTKEEIIGKHHSVLLTEKDKSSQDYKNFWSQLSRGETVAGEFKRIGKNGNEIWLSANYNPILDLNGKPFKVVKYGNEITQAKKISADNDGQLLSINRAFGSIEFTLEGIITKVNHNFASLTGYTESELIGKHHSTFISSAYKQSAEYAQFWQKLKSGEFDSHIYQRFGKNGQEIWLNASYNPIMDENGKPYKVVKFAVDVTAQKLAETTLQHAVEETKNVIEAAKSGDISNRISLEDKTGAIASLCEGVNALLENMTEVISQVKEAGETINTAASEIATGNNDLSSRTEQQASSLEETASSMEELASTVKQNAENAKQANQLAAAASGVAVKGGEVVGNVVTTMSAINESARKIEDIISVIDGIAFQTNILALNAAVEAARAGEQGRGFAVVAGEVRNLAQRSASAAKEIKDLISDSVSKTAEGTKLVESAGATMQEIVSSVQRVTDIMGEITAASQEQSSGIDQVNGAITSMDEVTQQNAALVEQAAAAAESLVEQASSLMETVGAFKLLGQSNNRSVKSTAFKASVTKSSAVKSNPLKTQERRSPTSPLRNNSASTTAPKATAKTGTDDAGDWEEF